MDDTPPGTHSLQSVAVAPVAATAAPSLVSTESSDGNFRKCRFSKLPVPVGYQRWVHAGWASNREKLYASMIRTGQTPARCDAFAGCCESGVLQRREIPESVHTEWRVKASRCHDRMCVPCSRLRTWDIQRALHAKTEAMQKPMLITLTLRSQPKDRLSAKIDELYSAFRELRQSTLWQRSCRGGAAFLELTRGDKGDRWHVHLHLVCDSDYIDQSLLSRAWNLITKGSFRVFLERPREGAAFSYATKYASKGLDYTLCTTDELLDEAVLALKGRRLAFCFGDWYGTSFAHEIEEDALEQLADIGGGWTTLGEVNDCLAAALGGDDFWRQALLSTDFGRRALAPPDPPPVP